MTSMHPARKRLLIGVLLLLGTFFYAFAGTCGLIGELVARISSKLLGQTGSTLLALTMLVTGLLLVVPHGAFASIVRWVFNGREARVARIVREGDRAADLQRIVDEAIKRHVAARAEAPAVKIEQPAPAAAPQQSVTERRKLDSVRDCLRQLQYRAYEYEPVVKALDPKLPVDTLVRSAIQTLHAASAN
jgi:hypothetical protein